MPRARISHVIGSLSTLAVALVVATTLASLPGATPGGAANTNRITIADSNALDAGKHSSLVLDTNGFPVISYGVTSPPAGSPTRGIRIMHCNDVDCSGGDEATVDIETDVPSHTSLALDTNGFPVVAFDSADNILRVLHCNDANCAGNDESVTTPDNGFVFGADLQMSMQLDGSGFPVIGYQRTNAGLLIMHCNDANCAGGDESLTGPTNATLGVQTSVSLKLEDRKSVV